MKFTEDNIKEIGLAIVGLIILAVIFFYSTTYIHRTQTSSTKNKTNCSQQLAVDQSVCSEKNNMLFVGCNGFF